MHQKRNLIKIMWPFNRGKSYALGFSDGMKHKEHLCFQDMLTDLRNGSPIKIEHQHHITRNIPRPTRIQFIVVRADGARYNMGSIDLTYQHYKEILLHPGMMSEHIPPDIPPIRLSLELEYDPADRH